MERVYVMKFEVINDRDKTVMYTAHIPNEEELTALSQGGYKFRIDGKIVAIKNLKKVKRGVENA